MKRVIAYAACAFLPIAATGQPAAHHHAGSSLAQTAPGFASDMDAGMEKMMGEMHAPGYTGNPDIDFLAMMIPHHAGAVEMARLVLIHGTDPATRRLAEEIIAGQSVEIEAMTKRLALLRAGGGDQGGYPDLGGIRGAGKAQ